MTGEIWSPADNLKGGTLEPGRMFTVGIEHFPGAIPPLLILRTAEGFLETLRRNLDDAQPTLKSREFNYRLTIQLTKLFQCLRMLGQWEIRLV